MRKSFTFTRVTTTVGGIALAGLLLSGCAGAGSTVTPPSTSKAQLQLTMDPALQAMLPEKIRSSGSVKVASDVPYPPFEFYDTDGKTIIGSDPDLARALGMVLGINFTIEPVAFDNIIPGLASGKYDVAMSGIADRKERQKVVTFVDYMTNKPAFLVQKSAKSKPTALAEICGLKIGAQAATTMAEDVTAQAATCTAAGKQAPTLSQFKGQDEAILALRSNRVDSVVLTAGSGAYIVGQASGEFEISGSYGGVVLGIAVAKDNQKLAEALQAAVQKLLNDGTYKSILDQWGLFKLNSTEKAVINGGTE